MSISQRSPTDARLLDGEPVEVDQSALRGELLPVACQAGETVYSGSMLRQGESDALVYGTGQHTYFGKTAHLMQEAHTVSHFQRAVLKLGDDLILLAAALVVLILAVALFRGDLMTTTLQFAPVLTVAAIPVSMPTVDCGETMRSTHGKQDLSRQAFACPLTRYDRRPAVQRLVRPRSPTRGDDELTLATVVAVARIPAP